MPQLPDSLASIAPKHDFLTASNNTHLAAGKYLPVTNLTLIHHARSYLTAYLLFQLLSIPSPLSSATNCPKN